jgi:beta-lactamase regulating signal transducer with metallopeptidase domain
MNWHPLLGYFGTADWIFLTAFHSLWLSLAAILILRTRKLSSSVTRATWCTFIVISLLVLPMVTWLVPRIDARAQPDQKDFVGMNAVIVHFQAPLLDSLLGMKTAHINQGRVLINQFGLLWLLVALGGLGRLLYELAFLKGYCNGLQEIEDDRVSAILQEINRCFRFRRKARIYVSPKLASPISVGTQIPSVILPASLYSSIEDGELRAILLHELAHLHHYDHLLGLAQRLVKAMYWWNPFVYRLCGALSVAREEVSDNYAISGIESAAKYARLLVSLVEKTSLINRMPCTAGMANPYISLERRISGIVSKERDMRVKTSRRTISIIALAAVLLCGLAVIGSQVQIFGLGQTPSSGSAGPVMVNINKAGAAFNMDLLGGAVLVLEGPGDIKYTSSPILINGDHGNCEFIQMIPPGEYRLVMSIFGLNTRVAIPPDQQTPVTMDINISPGGISIAISSGDPNV